MRKIDIVDVRDIDLDDIVIGKSQVRVREVGKGIDELAESIRRVGLLEPVTVCQAEEEGKYELVAGQRRFLAHQYIGAKTIKAAILDGDVDEIDAKVISLTENLVRRDLPNLDAIDACTALYKKYGSMKAVAEETGLPYDRVREYVKFDRLCAQLKEMVESGEVDLRTALRAQDASEYSESPSDEDAVKLAREMSQMSGEQQKRLVGIRADDPRADTDDAIEKAKAAPELVRFRMNMLRDSYQSLVAYANSEETNEDDAAVSLIEEGLKDKGFI